MPPKAASSTQILALGTLGYDVEGEWGLGYQSSYFSKIAMCIVRLTRSKCWKFSCCFRVLFLWKRLLG